MSTPELLSDRIVRLRHWREADLDVYREWLRPHQEWHQWDGPYFPIISDEAADKHVEELRQRVEMHNGVAWATTDGEIDKSLPVAKAVITDASSDELIGTVGWHWESKETEWARMGITVFDPGLRGSGRGTQALKLWTSHLFEATDWRRLDFSTWSGNTAMLRAGLKLGFAIEGRFRQARVVRGEVYDSIVMGVLRGEWAAAMRAAEA